MNPTPPERGCQPVRARRTRGAAGVLAALVLVLVSACRPGQPATPATPTVVSTTTHPARDDDPRSADGAVAAAVALAQASQRWLYLDDAGLVEAVTAVAAPGFEAVVVDDVVAAVQALRAMLASSTGPVWWVVAPLAWRLDAYRAGQARVSVWSVHVLAAPGVAVPQSDWVTTTFELAWTARAWRLQSSRDVPGPTPQLGGVDAASTSAHFAGALRGFTRLEVGS